MAGRAALGQCGADRRSRPRIGPFHWTSCMCPASSDCASQTCLGNWLQIGELPKRVPNTLALGAVATTTRTAVEACASATVPAVTGVAAPSWQLRLYPPIRKYHRVLQQEGCAYNLECRSAVSQAFHNSTVVRGDSDAHRCCRCVVRGQKFSQYE